MAPATSSTAPTSIPISPIPAKAGATISISHARPRPTRSSASATKRDCRPLSTSQRSGTNSRFGSDRDFLMGRVFVAGSINMDVVATAERHPAVGETVAGTSVLYFPGGKGANQAVAAAKLGAATTLIGRIGKDAFGRELRTFLADQGIDLCLVRDTADARTGTAIITLANAENTI